MLNVALRDVLGISLAFLLFTCVLLFPGYVVGWSINLFDFRKRQLLTKHGIAVLASMVMVPILFYLLAFFASFFVIKIFVACFFVLYLLIAYSPIKKLIQGRIPGPVNWSQKIALLAALAWTVLSTLSLVDLQWGTKLYNNVVSLDFATRVTLINAISRTGVPPVDPSYFPGSYRYITSLYYFWYILCSIIDQIGGDFVNAHMALIAGDIWCGLALMALIALYIKFRNDLTGESAWKVAVAGIGLLTVSGLDSIPASLLMLVTRFSFGAMWPHGDIEHWNEQVTAWVGMLFWVPHHVAALISCVTGLMILQHYRDVRFVKKVPTVLIAGLAFASAVGLSTWITVAFSAFLGIWSITLLLRDKDREMFLTLVTTGLVALLFASPFLLGVLQGETGGSGGIPFGFEVRKFRVASPFVDGLPAISQNIINLLLLPVNYFLELGFFSIVGMLWIRQYGKKEIPPNRFLLPEIILFFVVLAGGSFFRSTFFLTNDFGWRVWLLGQFVLLIWATDLNKVFAFLPEIRQFIKTNLASRKMDVKKLMAMTLFIGMVTSLLDVALLRTWPILVDMNVTGFPNSQSPDTRLGERTFDGRLAYEFINDELPEDVVIQQNPLSDIDRIDRPSGLYANRQFAISYNAAYNIPFTALRERSKQISQIFTLKNQESWETIDQQCRQNFIDVLVVGDLDPLWGSLSSLYQQRSALYENRYYAVLSCGDFVLDGSQNIP